MTFNQEHYYWTSDCFLNCILGAELPAWMSGYHAIILAAGQSSLAGKACHLNTHAMHSLVCWGCTDYALTINNDNATDVLFEWMPRKIIFVLGLKKVELRTFKNKIN